MSLLDLSWRNMKRDFRLYAIYFISMLIGVVIYFTFSSLMFNEDILAAIKNKNNFQLGVSITSVVVFLFIIFFILYANAFFMKQRKKEFGMYLLYGMSERQIALMVFIETCFLSVISLVSGIMIGGLLSKLFGMLLMNMMQYDEVISFAFPIEAVGLVILLFVVLIGIISIQSYLSVRRVQLVELFHAKAKMDKPLQFSAWLALGSFLLLGTAFFLVSRKGASVFWTDYFLASSMALTIGMIGGTYLFFRQFFGWILEKISRGKTYVEGSKMLWISSLRFSIRGNTLNLTFISLFSALIIFLVGFVSINYTIQILAAGKEFPNHLAFASQDEQTHKQIEQMIEEAHPIIDHKRIEGLSAQPVTDRKTAFGEGANNFKEELLLFPESQFNDMVSMRGDTQQVNLQNQDAVVLLTTGANPMQFTASDQPKFTVNVKEETTFNLVERKAYTLLSKATDSTGDVGLNPSALIISDEAFERLMQGASLAAFDIYQIEDARNSNALSHKVHDLVVQPGTYYAAFVDLYSIDIETSSLLLFSAAFLAVIALFAMGSIIYFKQLREATEEQKQYSILRKLGVDDREMKKIIRIQLLFVFLPPIVLGMLHSWFLLIYPTLEEVKQYPQIASVIAAVLVLYVAIYTLFYLSSTSIYYKIVNPRDAMS